jgi:hypothetical protein
MATAGDLVSGTNIGRRVTALVRVTHGTGRMVKISY